MKKTTTKNNNDNYKPFGGPPTLSGPWTLDLAPWTVLAPWGLDLRAWTLGLGTWGLDLESICKASCPPWGISGYPVAILGLFWDGLTGYLGHLEAILGHLKVILEHPGAILGKLGGYLAPRSPC